MVGRGKAGEQAKVLSLERPKVGRQLGITAHAGLPREDGHAEMGGLSSPSGLESAGRAQRRKDEI